MAESAPNIQNAVIRRLAGYRFELMISFRQDNVNWDVSNLPIKFEVRYSNDQLATIWNSADFTRPQNHQIYFDEKTPADARLTTASQYKVIAYLDQPTQGKEPLFRFDLYVDAGINAANQGAYSTNTIKPEGLLVETSTNVPTVSVSVVEGFDVRLSALEARVTQVEAIGGIAIFDDINDIEALATGPTIKDFVLDSGGVRTFLRYIPGDPTLYELASIPYGGGPVVPGGPTVSQRLATVEAGRIEFVTATTMGQVNDAATGSVVRKVYLIEGDNVTEYTYIPGKGIKDATDLL